MSKLCDIGGEKVVKLGTVMELVHVATLVHDDIIDKADLRRGRPSVNARWGSEITVLMGDWMYMTAFKIALELKNLRVLDVLIQLTRTMVTGEMMQLELDRKLETSVEDQIEICRRKTARLFSACASLPAILSGSGSEVEERLAEYGRALGMVFQLTDDMLDYTADEEGLGKPVMKDLEEGKITLPIIFLLEQANQVEREFIRRVCGPGRTGKPGETRDSLTGAALWDLERNARHCRPVRIPGRGNPEPFSRLSGLRLVEKTAHLHVGTGGMSRLLSTFNL